MRYQSAAAISAVLFVALGVGPRAGHAAVPEATAEKLRTDLTPVGAERAASKDGTIPAWTGGFSPKTSPIVGRRPDPFASEKPLFSITAKNMDQYADKLSAGVVATLKKYPDSYRVDVYPSHRTASMPQWFYDATMKDATTTKLVVESDNRSKLSSSAGGLPFPIPQNGMEVMFNHNMTYWPPYIQKDGKNYLIQADGKRILVSVYSNEVTRYFGASPERAKDGLYWAVRSRTTNPPIRAGEAIIGYYYEDGSKDSSWVYLPGQRRVRKLPIACCDTPTPFSAGIISFDEIVTFAGSLRKFDWNLIGKKEIYVPYNGNRVLVPKSVDEVFSGHHLNPDHVRWELHRVWVVEAKLRAGERHTSPRSVYYVDEDSWQALLADRYDAQGALARTGFTVPLLLTETSSFIPACWGWYDLLSGSGYVGSVFNEASEQYRVVDSIAPSTFSPDALAAESAR